ncbi:MULTISPECIES: hypothetical protein, partial [unclassified Aeromonas]|uniref:hypothetical protein n=1 Tax=unclassified Aeromonas TaxID=257493 RepID=UPI0022E7CF57
KQAGKWDQETIVSFFLCQYCSGEYLRKTDRSSEDARHQARSNHMHNMPINNPQPNRFLYRVMALPGPVAGSHDENMMDDPI